MQEIVEIANQLGVAADKVWEFVPEYAAFEIQDCLAWVCASALVFIVLGVVALVTYRRDRAAYNGFHEYEMDGMPFVFFILAVVAGIIFVSVAAIAGTQVFDWAMHPQAMFVNHVLSKLA